MDNERAIPLNSFLDEKRELSKPIFNKNKIQMTSEQNIISSYLKLNTNNSNNNKSTILSPIDVNTPPEDNSFSYQPKSYSNNTNSNDNVIIGHKRKLSINQEKSKKPKVDGIHQNWQRIQKYIRKHSKTEEDILNLKDFFYSFSSKTVPEQYKEDQLLLDVWFEFIHLLINVNNEVREIQNCFKFLRNHKIGRKNAQLYLEWAEFEQKLGNYEKAKDIISLGIDYKANPEISLISKLKIYQNLLNQNENETNVVTTKDNNFIKKSININKEEQYKIDSQTREQLNVGLDNKELYNKESYNNDTSNKENESKRNKKESYETKKSENLHNLLNKIDKAINNSNNKSLQVQDKKNYSKLTDISNSKIDISPQHSSNIDNVEMSKYNSSKWSNLYDEKLVTSLNNSHISSQYKEYNKFKDNIKDVPISTSLIDSYIDKNEILKENKNINDLDILFSKNLSEIKDDIMTSVNSSFITPVLNSSSSNSVLYNKNSLSTKYPVSEGKKDFHSLNSLNYSSMKSSKSDDILNTIFSSKYKTENEYKELDDFKQNKENIKYQKEIDNHVQYQKSIPNPFSETPEKPFDFNPLTGSNKSSSKFHSTPYSSNHIYNTETPIPSHYSYSLENNDYKFLSKLENNVSPKIQETNSAKKSSSSTLYLVNDENTSLVKNKKNYQKTSDIDYYNTPIPMVSKKTEKDSSNVGLLGLKLSPIEATPKNDNILKKSFYNQKDDESNMNFLPNYSNFNNSSTKKTHSVSKSSYAYSNKILDSEINRSLYNKDDINSNDINISSHSSSTTNNSSSLTTSGTINSNIISSNNNSIISNINNGVSNNSNSKNQNIIHSSVMSNPSITNEQNSAYSTPYSHLPQSQPQSLPISNYKASQVPDEYIEYQYSFDKSLNDINKDEPSISQQRIDNIPRSIIQYIYSLFSKGSTVFTCNNKRYMSLQQIGRGGTSKVYKVLSQEGKILALKKIDINGSDKTAFQGYINEINLLNHLKNNSRIIQLMDSEINRDTNSIYMVMECGEIDLARLLQKEGNKISISSIKMYWEQMLKAVHAIHEENIIHSDLKPANFLLVGGALKLIDFGIAKAIPNDTTNIHRETQTGTVNYMSPESISDFNADVDSDQRPDFKISRASDVWYLGCILYQMVYGKPPFFRENTIFKKI